MDEDLKKLIEDARERSKLTMKVCPGAQDEKDQLGLLIANLKDTAVSPYQAEPRFGTEMANEAIQYFQQGKYLLGALSYGGASRCVADAAARSEIARFLPRLLSIINQPNTVDSESAKRFFKLLFEQTDAETQGFVDKALDLMERAGEQSEDYFLQCAELQEQVKEAEAKRREAEKDKDGAIRTLKNVIKGEDMDDKPTPTKQEEDDDIPTPTTQEERAEIFGVTVRTIGRWDNGHSKPPLLYDKRADKKVLKASADNWKKVKKREKNDRENRKALKRPYQYNPNLDNRSYEDPYVDE